VADYLYIHIPFCVRKCMYCDFLSVPFSADLAERYIGALCNELILRKDSAGILKTVYIGGGTPSLLPDRSLRRLFDCLRKNFIFSHNPEITLEANPGTLDGEKIATLLSSGVTRISIGVQSFNDGELKTLGRIHTSQDAARATERLQKAGLENYSLDLMYGIPGQTRETWEETLSQALRLSPRHISAYELTPEKNTPLYGLIRSGGVVIPDEGLVLDMYDHAIDRLAASGYSHYEISNFALPGYECLHNINYWNRGEYLGAGAGAHSFLDVLRSRNTEDLEEYCDFADRGAIPSVETLRTCSLEASRELIFLGLRKTAGIQIDEAKAHGLDIVRAGRMLVDEGYLESASGKLRLTRKGLPVSNAVIVKLFAELNL
jgi:oxygen-independent coproporphyrinogen-3 oxidase